MLSERLIQARKASGLTVKALAEKMGNAVTAQAISKYEKNKCKPTSETLIALSKALGVRTEYFFRPLRVNLGEIHFRKHSRLPARTLNKIEARSRDFVERYLSLEDMFPKDRFPGFKNPLKSKHVATPEQAENRATELRRKWELGLNPIPVMTELLEDRGIKVILIESEDGFDGLFAMAGQHHPIVVIGKGWDGDRQRMTLAHELGHLVLEPEGEPKKQERLIMRFAGAFLVPQETALKELGEHRRTLTWPELIPLKRIYGMSIKAWILRARDLGIISESRYVSLLKFYNKKGWGRGEPEQLPSEEPTRFKRLLYQALAEGLLTESKAAELDGRPLRAFLQKMATEGAVFADDPRG